jgi:hypothetical protein
MTEYCALCHRSLDQALWDACAAAREFDDVTYAVCWRCLPTWVEEVLDRLAVAEEWAPAD